MMKELSKAASLYQSLPQGDSYNTVVGSWFVNDAVTPQEWKFPLQQLQVCSNVLLSSLNPQATQADQKMQVFHGNQQQPQQSRPLLVSWFQTSKTSQSKMSN